MTPSTQAARLLMQALAASGVQYVVLSPGSRSAPLACAAAEAALPAAERDPHAPHLNLYVRSDERCAGFLAVGLARAAAARGDNAPVAVITTSGSAVANLHPAVLEAHHAGLPLLLLTADRPHELRGTGANQTTDQVGLFGTAVRLVLDMSAPAGFIREIDHIRRVAKEAVAVAIGASTGDPGPVHINLAYREPLVADVAPWPTPAPLPDESLVVGSVSTEPLDIAPFAGWDRNEPTVVIAGDGAGSVARRVAEANGWPLLAEPSSDARGGPNAIPAYRLVLESLGPQVRRVVVLGRSTLNRPVRTLLARRDIRSLVIARRGSAAPEAGRGATYILSEVPPWLLEASVAPDAEPSAWLAQWRAAGKIAAQAVREVLDEPNGDGVTGLRGPELAAEIASAIGRYDVLVVGASNSIRDLDLVAAWDAPPMVLANRGLSGIDGTTSTASGVALGLDRPVRAYLGDVAFLHDIGGLFVGTGEVRPDLQLIVANDRGGSIFSTLEYGDSDWSPTYERVFTAPHNVDIAGLCSGYGIAHVRVDDVASLREALVASVSGLSVVEVTVDRSGRRDLQARLSAAVAGAIAAEAEGEAAAEAEAEAESAAAEAAAVEAEAAAEAEAESAAVEAEAAAAEAAAVEAAAAEAAAAEAVAVAPAVVPGAFEEPAVAGTVEPAEADVAEPEGEPYALVPPVVPGLVDDEAGTWFFPEAVVPGEAQDAALVQESVPEWESIMQIGAPEVADPVTSVGESMPPPAPAVPAPLWEPIMPVDTPEVVVPVVEPADAVAETSDSEDVAPLWEPIMPVDTPEVVAPVVEPADAVAETSDSEDVARLWEPIMQIRPLTPPQGIPASPPPPPPPPPPPRP